MRPMIPEVTNNRLAEIPVPREIAIRERWVRYRLQRFTYEEMSWGECFFLVRRGSYGPTVQAGFNLGEDSSQLFKG